MVKRIIYWNEHFFNKQVNDSMIHNFQMVMATCNYGDSMSADVVCRQRSGEKEGLLCAEHGLSGIVYLSIHRSREVRRKNRGVHLWDQWRAAALTAVLSGEVPCSEARFAPRYRAREKFTPRFRRTKRSVSGRTIKVLLVFLRENRTLFG